jgi:16S rRNA (guanine(966)-N(2))-methyltransferase RsmD
LFAGTGAIGIEALSRGAASVTFVESDQGALELLQKNLTVCGLMNQAEIHPVRTDIFVGRPEWWGGPFDIVFADPPYAAHRELDVLWSGWTTGLIAPMGVMVVEHVSKSDLPSRIVHAVLLRRYVYGDTALHLYGQGHAETGAP